MRVSGLNTSFCRPLALFASLLACTQAAADTWYHVELVAFEYLAPQYVDGERWSGDVGALDLENVLELIEDVPDFDDDPIVVEEIGFESEQPMAFKALTNDEYHLQSLSKRLARSAQHRVLAHVAWRQPKFENRDAKFIHIKPPANGVAVLTSADPLDSVAPRADPLAGMDAPLLPPPVVEGVLRVRSGYQLHVDADFIYYRDEIPVRLAESRRINLREIHYFDHPLFGLLLQVTPFVFGVPPEEQEVANETENN